MPYTIPFDRDCLDLTTNLARLDVLVGAFANVDFMTIKQLPARLLQGERAIFPHFLEVRKTTFSCRETLSRSIIIILLGHFFEARLGCVIP
ncbi:MAG: hypothetical protein CUN55_08195 [Phototrophicales bacterium]|nr:MAG: hypothetical protein CUN55_08195 [Phototrophicales bacterium]